MPFLIDGHNVIAALPDIELEDPEDEAKLVIKLRAWSARERRKVIVIFDGGVPGGPSPVLSTSEVRVIFAAKYHSTADRIIKERLSKLPDAPNWTVVSSDREVLDNARAAGAKTLTAREYVKWLNRLPVVEKEKAERVSAEEVEAWLEVFQEPQPASEPPPPPVTQPADKVTPAPRPQAHRMPEKQPPRTTRSIGEQLGMAAPSQPEKPRQVAGKPDDVSPEEVADWLKVFHDMPESAAPPPKPKPAAPPRPSKPPVVKKHAALSAEEVETWLEIFGGEPEEAEMPPADKSATAKPSKAPPSRLAKRKQQLAPTQDEGAGRLSKEDEALWRRIFGKEER